MANTPTAVYGFNKPAQGDTPWTTMVNGDWDSVDSELARPRIIYSSPVVGATTTCDLANGRGFTFTVSQVTTLAFTNVPSSSFLVRIVLLITNGAAFALTWPGSVTWIPGVVPTLKTAGVDIIELFTVNGGTTWYGAPHLGATTRVNTQFVGPIGTAALPSFQVGGAASGSGVYGSPTVINLSAAATGLFSGTAAPNLAFWSAHLAVDGAGPYNIYGSGSHATTGTTGFIFLNTCAGTPTGVPAAVAGVPAGNVAALYDTTANKLWVYNGAWRGVVLA